MQAGGERDNQSSWLAVCRLLEGEAPAEPLLRAGAPSTHKAGTGCATFHAATKLSQEPASSGGGTGVISASAVLSGVMSFFTTSPIRQSIRAARSSGCRLANSAKLNFGS